jgi:hypothetical protein
METPDFGHILHRNGVLGGHFFQRGVLENDVGRQVVFFGDAFAQVFEHVHQHLVEHGGAAFFVVEIVVGVVVVVVDGNLDRVGIFARIRGRRPTL